MKNDNSEFKNNSGLISVTLLSDQLIMLMLLKKCPVSIKKKLRIITCIPKANKPKEIL